MRVLGLGAAVILAWCGQAAAELQVRYFEGAPKDRFVIENLSGCALGEFSLEIDLRPSAGGLIFDTELDGAGINVAQPFELVAGGGQLAGRSEVGDGEQTLMLRFAGLERGAPVIFTIDLDDTLPSGSTQTMVQGDEMIGAVVRFQAKGLSPLEGLFDATSQAILPVSACVSGLPRADVLGVG